MKNMLLSGTVSSADIDYITKISITIELATPDYFGNSDLHKLLKDIEDKVIELGIKRCNHVYDRSDNKCILCRKDYY